MLECMSPFSNFAHEGPSHASIDTSKPPTARFGDQEEMGLGVRAATTVSELGGGKRTDFVGRSGTDPESIATASNNYARMGQ